MIAKLITFAATREENIQKMIRAIDEYDISGVETTLAFCKFVLQHDAFISGHFNTTFVEKYFTTSRLENVRDAEKEKLAAAFTAFLLENEKETSDNSYSKNSIENNQTSRWRNRLR
jgi:propionyl-CoA carboxylase alpha chain